MAVCDWCGEEMTKGRSCSVAEFHRGGKGVAMIRFGDERATVVDGISYTTALRTVIDVACDVEIPELERLVRDCLARRLFTAEEAFVRLSADDMRTRPGAGRLRALIARKSWTPAVGHQLPGS